MKTYQLLRRFIAIGLLWFSASLYTPTAIAQTESTREKIDPRLVEIAQIVKNRIKTNPANYQVPIESLSQDEIYLALVDRMETASYSHEAKNVMQATEDFNRAYKNNASIGLSNIDALYVAYAELLGSGASHTLLQDTIAEYTASGNWFERYMALSLAAHVHGTAGERQAALQKAQLALSLIPTKPNGDNRAFVDYANARVVSLIAKLHNFQGNSELALTTSLKYLSLTKNNPDLKAEVDLLNNLIYSYSIGRNHEAQLYLSEQLSEIEKTQSSSVQGLSEMRISGVMNSSGRFAEGLEYAEQSIDSATNPIVLRVSQVNKATALAGLGRVDEARAIAKVADVNLAPEHMLKTETRSSDLYLAFLLAQAEDQAYATQLFNRQLDVKAQNFLANNSRDTTSMLAALENSRERQAEREAASAREAQLQAITISRQKKLNRALMALSFFLGLAVLAAILFARFRGRVLRKLEIKTLEAASAEKLKTEFLGMISHELRTPLNGIIGISDYLSNYHEDEDIRQKTGIVLKSGNELLTVVESLTDMARIDAGQLALAPHDAELGAALETVPENWTEMASGKGLIFTHFIDPAVGRHHVDEDRIVQCVNILLGNAIRFTDSGRVHLHITAPKTESSDLSIVVADTGRGMSELVQSRLFKPFMQADTSRKRTHMGTGLNLAIAYALAEMMGGSLSCVSREGRGSEFTLGIPLPDAKTEAPAFPVIPEPEAQIETASQDPITTDTRPPPPARVEKRIDRPVLASPRLETAAAHPPSIEPLDAPPAVVQPILDPPILERAGPARSEFVDLMAPAKTHRGLHEPIAAAPLQAPVRPLRVLIVDDMMSNRDVLSLMLESKGHICRDAADGYAALSLLERQSFDLIILDIHMAPLDGIETLRRVRSSGKSFANIPVIALTADNAPSINAETMDAGADLFLTKPIKQEELFRAMGYLRSAESTRILSQRA